MTDRNIFYAIDILDSVRCQGTFRQDAENKVIIYLENDQVAELQDFYFPVFEVHLYRTDGQLYLFVCSNEVSVYHLDEENRCKPKLLHKFAPNMYFDCVINLTILSANLLYLRTGDRHIAFFNYTLSSTGMETKQLLNQSLYSIQFVPRPNAQNQFISLGLPTDHDAVIQIYKLDEENKLSKITSDLKLPLVPDKVQVLSFNGDRPSKILYMTMQQLGIWELSPGGQLETTVLCNYAGFLIYNFLVIQNNLLCIIGTNLAIYDLDTRKFRLANGFKDFSAENLIYTEKYGLILVGNGMKRIKNLEEVMQDDVDPMELVRKLNN